MPDELAKAPEQGGGASEIAVIKSNMDALQEFVQQTMEPGHHFGQIPGTPKPTLLKPGAELLCEFYKLAPTVEIIRSQEDFGKGFFAYTIKVILIHKVAGV